MQFIHASVSVVFLITVCNVGCVAQDSVALSSCDDSCVAGLENKALRGDAASAVRLATHYSYTHPEEVKYWEEIAAENGDPDYQRVLAHEMLLFSKDRRDHVRGVFWLEKAAAGGARGAEEDLRRYREGGAEAMLPESIRK